MHLSVPQRGESSDQTLNYSGIIDLHSIVYTPITVLTCNKPLNRNGVK
jgi:hypothetical protein